ncbi:hypothetical protein V491_00920 [Pseudogymnoascus sp. VKM F-3775]|nr:hypothetical protein V491_00920 [Pseudogymnoascus sp. VKM F-3775]
MATPTPFQINVSDSSIKSLNDKLSLATFPDELTDANWELGAPLSHVQRLSEYWRHGFDWRTQEAKLNQLPQFTTKIAAERFGELDIHFVHQESKVDGAIPLLFVHGWPGSFIEVTKLLPILTAGSKTQPAFHVVAPSLPGFGFSGGPKERGFGLKQHAETMHNLMVSLGYDEYVTQGGDWGAFITRSQGLLYPQSVKASHLNFFPTVPSLTNAIYHPITTLQVMFNFVTNYTEGRRRLAQTSTFLSAGSGYNVIQSSRPQTIGYAQADSPVALLAWIYEKLHDWTDAYPWTDDEILTWVSIYWFSAAGPAASSRIYHEARAPDAKPKNGDIHLIQTARDYSSGPKFGLSHFPKELMPMPYSWGRMVGAVVQEVEHESGGHFAAWEKPEELCGDVRKMFSKDGPCYGIVKGRDGYVSSAM